MLSSTSEDVSEESKYNELDFKSQKNHACHIEQPQSNTLSIWRKLAFAAGGLPMQQLQNISALFLSLFILETVHLSPIYLSIILFTARFSDAITDPIVGYFIMKTKSRYGQKRPWLFFSTPVFAVSFFVLFYAVEWPLVPKFCLYLFSNILLQVGVTCFHVPYSSMTMALTVVRKERDSLTAFRMFSETAAILVGATVFGGIINPYRVASQCGVSSLNSTTSEGEAWAYMTAASTNSVIAVIAALICVFGSREVCSTTEGGDSGHGNLPYFKAVRLVLTYRPYLHLMAAFLFVSLAIQFVQGNLTLYITHSLKLNDHMFPGILTVLSVTICLIPFAQFLLIRLGKKNTLALGILNAFPLLAVFLFIPQKPPLYAFYLTMVWAGFPISVAMLLPWSMLPDVIDAFSLEHNMRLEAVFYSLIVFFNKFAVGISMAISSAILGYVGYESEKSACVQPETVGKALRLLSSIGPLIFLLPALIFLYFYPFGNEQLKDMREKLLVRLNNSNYQSKVTLESPEELNL